MVVTEATSIVHILVLRFIGCIALSYEFVSISSLTENSVPLVMDLWDFIPRSGPKDIGVK
jgi:hypothetical protein